MSSAEKIIFPDHKGSLPAEIRSPTDNVTHYSHGKDKKRVQNRLAQRSYRRRMKAKLEELRDKVKVHEQQVEGSASVPSSNSTSSLNTTSTIPDSMWPATMMRYDSAISVDFLMTPLGDCDIDDGYPPYGANVMGQAEFPKSDDLATGFEVEGAFCSPQSLHDLSPNNGAQQHFTDYVTDEVQDVKRNVDATAPVQDRIRHVIEQAAAVGFDTLDAAAVAYYTEIMEDTSPLCRDQRVSRNRQLPRLLSTLHNASKHWSEWERRGFQEQITLGAEEILAEELRSFITHQQKGKKEIANKDLCGEQHGCRRGRIERQKVQDHLPNLWALTTALLARQNAPKQETSPDKVLAVIETLCFDRRGKPRD